MLFRSETLNVLDRNIPIIKGYPHPVDRKIARDVNKGEEINSFLEDFYIDSINSYKDVVLLSIGPMTNLYWLLKNRPEIFVKLNKIISMGGAYEVRGNVTEFAEYNYWADSIAADYFYYNSGIIIDMIPLDICSTSKSCIVSSCSFCFVCDFFRSIIVLQRFVF